MSDLEVIEKAVQSVAKLPRKERLAEINRLLSPKSSFTDAQLKTPAVKDLLNRRALFMTALRVKGIWP